jgi:SnoaL-like domain
VLDTFNREGIATTAPFAHQDLEVHPFPEWPGPDLYRGMDGLTRLVEEWTQNFDNYRWDPHRFIDAGQRVVILARHEGDTKDQGVAVDQPVGAVYLDRGAADSPNGLLPDLAGGSRSRRAPGDRPPTGQVGPLRRVGGSAGRQRALCQLPAAS